MAVGAAPVSGRAVARASLFGHVRSGQHESWAVGSGAEGESEVADVHGRSIATWNPTKASRPMSEEVFHRQTQIDNHLMQAYIFLCLAV